MKMPMLGIKGPDPSRPTKRPLKILCVGNILRTAAWDYLEHLCLTGHQIDYDTPTYPLMEYDLILGGNTFRMVPALLPGFPALVTEAQRRKYHNRRRDA